MSSPSDWLRENDPEAAALIDEQHRLERIGWEILRRDGRLRETGYGLGASWWECEQAARDAGYE